MGIKLHSVSSRTAPVGLAFALALQLAGGSAQALDVPVLEARSSSTGTRLSIEGHLEPLRQATVSAQLGGSVLALMVKAGDSVKAGQVIARIDARDAQAGVLRSDAGLAQARAEVQNAAAAATRTRELRSRGFVSQAALDTVETQLQAAQAAVQQAQAARSQAALAQGFATVVAPFGGVILATHLDAGDLATAGRAVATLYAPGALRATAQIPQSQADAARQASRVEIELADGQRVQPLRVTELSTTDPVSQTTEWRFDLPASAVANASPGQVTRVHFSGAATPVTATTALQLPATAILHRGELTAVYLVQGERFVLRAVRVGGAGGTGAANPAAGAARVATVDVLAGLKAGDQVAVDALKAGLADARPAR
jgi:RND family efflux transporter MFP subunit